MMESLKTTLLVFLVKTSRTRACECTDEYTYFPEIYDFEDPDVILEYGYCEYRPNKPCRYIWESLIRADLEVVDYECYAPEDRRCDLSLAMTQRTFYLKEKAALQGNVTGVTTCDDDMKGALKSVFEYCGSAKVCLGSEGEPGSFRDIEEQWKQWLKVTHHCDFEEA